ncbi:MAG: phosphoenolpyruvate carboxykinase [Phycisphaerae bacterium]|nr:phosphoenolpyruvate carboxykinase [Phycisphaerae bacterium]
MLIKRFEIEREQLVIHTEGQICASKRELTHSEIFYRVICLYVTQLCKHRSPLLDLLGLTPDSAAGSSSLLALLRPLSENSLEQVVDMVPGASQFLEPARRRALHEFVEGLYDFWRTFDRFMVVHSEPGPTGLDQRPYRVFNDTIESLSHLVRSVYRDLCENITGDHPRVYRQVAAACKVGLIAVPEACPLPSRYHELLNNVPFIRQVWVAPPMIIDPPMNRRTGQFQKATRSPLDGLSIDPNQWLCYPAVVGPLVIFVYFHQKFIGLGCSLANLFELATTDQIRKGPHAVYLFGVPPEAVSDFGELPTIFYEDEGNDLLVAAVPGEDRFGYFGYLKKMILTLHNILMMKRGRMPYHGAMVRISLDDGQVASVLLIGDTATGKSESLEAFRTLGKDCIRDLRIIADDMGSLDIGADGGVLAYGTEIGAFVRLDDLQQGYAFGQLDRAIIMSPQKTNARVVLPVTTLDEVLHGYRLDLLLYANNYEEVDDEHPIIERFENAETALSVFREGAAMAKGTTTSTGLVHSYFANIFGAPQYKELHEPLAEKVFRAAFESGVFVGQLRTRLGIAGYETKGPEAAAEALLTLIAARKA